MEAGSGHDVHPQTDGWFVQVGDPFGSAHAAVPKCPSTGLFTDSGSSVVYHHRRVGFNTSKRSTKEWECVELSKK